MDEHPASLLQPLVDKLIGCGEVLNQVFIFYIINLDLHVLKRGEEILIKRQSDHREYVCDIGLLERISTLQREHATIHLS